MISLVVPTRNRAHALAVTSASYFAQAAISEIIFVDDASVDGTPDLLRRLADEHPEMRTILLRNDRRLGCPRSRTKGFAAASNELVMFCDDDELMTADYASTVARRLRDPTVGACSGRRVFKLPSESPEEAVARFGLGQPGRKLFDYRGCEGDWAAFADGDVDLPLLPSAFVTRSPLLERYGFDPRFGNGNAYREESDFQMSVFNADYRLVLTNDAHTVHLSRAECHTGGNRTSSLVGLFWRIALTWRFFDKHWDAYAPRVGQSLGSRRAGFRYARLQLRRRVRIS